MHPYKSLEEKFFWATAVAKRNMFDISDLWDPKFRIRKNSKVATYGSCFAQHIGHALMSRDYNWFISERPPSGVTPETAKNFNYGIFSARTGNIYTVSLLKQWVDWASGDTTPPSEIWENNGRFFDPFRPNIEPNGFSSEEELIRSRAVSIEAFRKSIVESEFFVYTLGLTESWINKEAGHEYPMCPGTLVGEFDSQKHHFVNQDFPFIRKTLAETIQRINKLNKNIKILLTVSPVPLTATMSGNHILVATMESKSILRAVAGTMVKQFSYVDYFPSYEIINATPFRGTFFEANQRSVNHVGVDHVMNSFFSCLNKKFPASEEMSKKNISPEDSQLITQAKDSEEKKPSISQEDVVCEEELLNAFAK